MSNKGARSLAEGWSGVRGCRTLGLDDIRGCRAQHAGANRLCRVHSASDLSESCTQSVQPTGDEVRTREQWLGHLLGEAIFEHVINGRDARVAQLAGQARLGPQPLPVILVRGTDNPLERNRSLELGIASRGSAVRAPSRRPKPREKRQL
jgi:hypothetical protein